MKNFIINFFLFIFAGIITSIIYLFIITDKFFEVYKMKNLAPPNFSNSISFNSKIDFMAQKKADVISVGSSMTTNNLHSKVIVDGFNKSYLNLSSWGMRIKDTYRLIKVYSIYHKPEVIIIASNMVDFQGYYKRFKEEDIVDYIKNKNSILYHVKYFSPIYYAENFTFFYKNTQNRTQYASLLYDDYGAVLFEKESFNISNRRWHNTETNIKIDIANYQYLDSICIFCLHNKIDFVFVQTPFREGLLDRVPKEEMQHHIKKCSNIVSQRKHLFINGTSKIWGDTLFTDGIHFNKFGAYLFTQMITDSITAYKQKINKSEELYSN